ncbi:MAG: helix-turn-helix domain-containing protein [Propionibacteriaceae bacterium]|nr:helix-turn-helix domain-containing protein [Propionibacteriaceae bacterium]
MSDERLQYKREGFPGQKLRVVPRSIIRTALEAPVTSQLVVTDCGHFPHATSHGRVRPHGAGQTVVILCTHGHGWAEVNGVRHQIGPRQALIIPTRTPHSYGAEAQDPWTIWWLHLEGAQLDTLVDACGVTRQRPVLPVPALAQCTDLIRESIEHLERDETLPSLLAASGAAWHLLTTLAAGRVSPHDGPVEEIKEVLAEDLELPLAIADLAARVNLSPSHLTALFKSQTGYAPMQYRTLLRMQRARSLLDTSDKPVAVIAREVGYEDVAYFSRRFSELHEQSPRAYRNTNKG